MTKIKPGTLVKWNAPLSLWYYKSLGGDEVFDSPQNVVFMYIKTVANFRRRLNYTCKHYFLDPNGKIATAKSNTDIETFATKAVS